MNKSECSANASLVLRTIVYLEAFQWNLLHRLQEVRVFQETEFSLTVVGDRHACRHVLSSGPQVGA